MDEDRMICREVDFTQKFRGVLKNWQLVFNKVAKGKEGVGYANIAQNESSIVEGIIYKTNKDSITKLDKFEGYPRHYQKQNIEVESDNGKFFKCVVYIANPAKVREGLKPEREYLSHLLKGRKFLSENYVYFLKEIQTFEQ